MTARPWRAVASLRFGPGMPPLVLARTSAKHRAGLDRFIDRHAGSGAHVEVWQVLAHPAIDDAARAQAAHSSPRVQSPP